MEQRPALLPGVIGVPKEHPACNHNSVGCKMYSYGASEAKQRKESHLAKMRHSRGLAPRRASLDASARDEESTAVLEGDGGGGGLYVAPVKGEVHGGRGGGGGGKLYVAVGKDEEDGRSNLLWARRNLLAGDEKPVLHHVHQPAHRIMTGFRTVDASQLQEKELKAYRKDEAEEMNTLLNSREATQSLTKVESPQSGYTSTDSDRSELPARSQTLSPGHTSFFGSTHQKALQQQSNQPVSYIYPLSASITGSTKTIPGARGQSTCFSLNSSQLSYRGSSQPLKDLDNMNGSVVSFSVTSCKEHRHSKIETDLQKEVFGQLQQLLHDDLECREAFENPMTLKAEENSLRKERNELVERLTRKKAGLNKERLHLYNELQKTNEKRAGLEKKLLQINSVMEEVQREKELAVKQAEEIVLTDFSYEEIKEATNNFDDSKKIGEGGCGSVYKGFLRHTTVAIKKLNSEGARGDQEFNDEVETLCGIRHPNLVTLIGACREARALVFEFMSNGSLEDCLQREHPRETLSWRTRVKIAADICTGLIFLHSNKPKGIAHGDLKPDNVLLDANFVCKLADFGISRPLNVTKSTITPYHQTNQLKGTMGYMDPTYIASGQLTAQYDVYSFGVVLMRLLTSKSPLGLPHVVEEALRKDKLQDIIDTSAGGWPPKHTKELAKLALRCCRYERRERPDLANEVSSVLEAMINCPDEKHKPPKFPISPSPTTQDPHLAANGFTYEGSAIKRWFKMGNKISPVARVNFAHHALVPNNALRSAIHEWKK